MQNETLSDKTIYVIDSYGLIYRAYFAFVSRPLINKEGKNISAIFGFFRMLHTLIKQFQPRYCAAAFDSRVKTFRSELYPDYKANRQKAPDDLHEQIPAVEEILTALGIPIVRMDGFEADDIIATIARVCRERGFECRIVSSDKDLMQLVDSSVKMISPDKDSGWTLVGSDQVAERWGVPPSKMTDLLSLMGDSSDNIPGVPGVGEKTARTLLTKYDSLDDIYANINNIGGAAAKKLESGRESAFFSRSLIKLRDDVAIDFDAVDLKVNSFKSAKVAEMLENAGAYSAAKLYAAGFDGGAEIVKSESALKLSNAKSQLFKDDSADSARIIRRNAGDYEAVTDRSVLENIIDAALQKGFAAFDCETTGLNPLTDRIVGFSLCIDPGTAWYVPLTLSAEADSSFADKLIPQTFAKEQLTRLLSNESFTLIGHNIKFDYLVLRAWGLSSARCKFCDTMVAAWILSPERTSFTLDALCAARLGLRTIHFDEVAPKGATFDSVNLSEAVQYAAEDADMALQLSIYWEPLLEEAEALSLFTDIEMKLLPILAEMEFIGIKILPQELVDYGKEMDSEIKLTEQSVYKLTGREFNVASPKQLQAVLFGELGLPAGKKTKTGYSTDSSVLEDLADKHPVPEAILRYRFLAKLKSTYADTLPNQADANGRIHTSFIQTGTATGRLSSRDPNLQNIPIREEAGRKIRKSFCAQNGWRLISADYSQIELVILAHFSGDPALRGAFKSNVDVHKRTASLIFGIAEDAVTADMRRIAKTINFGVLYGMSAFRLAKELKISRIDAQGFIDAYFATYRGVRAFMDAVIAQAEKTGYVETLMGRRRYIPDIMSKNKTVKAAAERVAVNTPIQGSAADIVKKAMIRIYQSLLDSGAESRILLQVHDELILEAPEREESAVRAMVKREMENVVQLSIPLRVSVESGMRWGDFH